MLRYKLRTLLIVLALGPPVLAGAWLLLSRNPALLIVLPFALIYWSGIAVLELSGPRST